MGGREGERMGEGGGLGERGYEYVFTVSLTKMFIVCS